MLVLLVAVVTGAWAQDPTYAVKMANATDAEAANWTIASGQSSVKGNVADGLTGLKENDAVTVSYTGRMKVKNVTATTDAADNTYLKWDDGQKKLVATDIPTTANKVQNSDQNVEWAGTYVVEGEVTINGMITLNGNVDLIIKDGAKLTVNNYIKGSDKNLSIYGQANQTGQLVVYCSYYDAILSITTLEVHSCQVTATSSEYECGGFYYIKTFNVYGGSFYAECTNTGTGGYGIRLAGSGSMNIYGGDVKAVGKGNNSSYSYGIMAQSSSSVTVYGGKLWAECAGYKAINPSNVTLTKDAGYTSGKIQYSSDNNTWSETADANAKYVRVGY